MTNEPPWFMEKGRHSPWRPGKREKTAPHTEGGPPPGDPTWAAASASSVFVLVSGGGFTQ
ncbi:hypothetical protein [Streptomyces sp. NPDC090029]|uniref:hypothetical protein n=1 Tax=Streptomyces sp. NPDC090029 TaxID=3365924 RepID=UPI003815086F